MKLLLHLGFLLFIFTAPLKAQTTKVKTPKKGEFTPFPYINYSNSQGFMYGLGALYTFKTNHADSISPKSTIGVTGIGTAKKSWFGVAFTQLYFHQDDWRVIAALGYGTYNFQTFLDYPPAHPQFYDYTSQLDFASARVLRRVYKKNYLGLGYYYNKTITKFDILNKDSTLTSQAIEAVFLSDNRDNVYYPHKGLKTQIMFTSYPTFMGNAKNFGILNAFINKYFSFGNEDVLAVRAFAKVGTTSLDFQRQVLIQGVDLRGYTDGKYRGSQKYDIQAEYRYVPTKFPRFGLVAFAGVATIFGSQIDDFNGKAYGSGGLGIRFTAVKSSHMRIGMDVARGKDNWAVYFRLGEAF